MQEEQQEDHGAETADIAQSTPNPLEQTPFPGFALERLELFNWGTFHEEIWTLEANSGATMIVGENGCGKSSAADALLALLVPQRIAGVKFNSAAHSSEPGVKGRDLGTYVTGQYANTTGENGQSQSLMLRPPGSGHYTVILAVFKNEYTQSYVTLAWLMQMPADETADVKRYMYAEQKKLSIEDHFTGLGGNTLQEARAQIRERFGLNPAEDVGSYWRRTCAFLGFTTDEQSQRLFAKGISTKEIHSFTDFVRGLMIEYKDDVLKCVKRAVEHFSDLEASYKAALIAEAKCKDLFNIQSAFQKQTTAAADIEFNLDVKSEAPTHFLNLRIAALQKKAAEQEGNLKKAEKEILSASKDIEDLQRQLQTANQQYLESGGGLAMELERKIEDLKTKLTRIQQDKKQLEESLSNLNIAMPTSQEAFETLVQSSIPKKLESLTKDGTAYRSQRDALHEDQISPLQKTLKEAIEELSSLESSTGNIDSKRRAIRDQMALDLNLDPSRLPFFGEIVQVKATATSWAPAIERALQGISKDILVPENHIRQVSMWMEKMEKNGVRGIVQTLKVPSDQSVETEKPQVGYLPEKLEYDTQSFAHQWVRNTILKDFNYLCTDDIEELDRNNKALSKTGQIKSFRHKTASFRKDTRLALGSVNNLGWNNEAKKSRIRRELEDIRSQLGELQEDSKLLLEKEASKFKDLRSLQDIVTRFVEYAQIDQAGTLEALSVAEKELEQSKENNSALKLISQKIDKINDQRKAREIELQSAAEKKGRLSQGIEDTQRKIERLKDECIHVPDAPLRRKAIQDAIEAQSLVLDLDDETALSKAQSDTVKYFEKKLEALRSSKANHLREMEVAQVNFTNQYREHNTLLPGVEHFEQWDALLLQLQEMDMASFKLKLRDRFGSGVITDLNMVANAINSEINRVKDGVEQLNDTLRPIAYNKKNNTYLKLVSSHENDPAIAHFKEELKKCLSLRTDFTSTLSDEEYLSHFETVRNFIAKLHDPIAFQRARLEKGEVLPVKLSEKWTEHVTDIRNWYCFHVTEHLDFDESLYYDHRNTGQKSGGEQQKITYAMIGAAFLYNYRLNDVLRCRKKGINDPSIFGEHRFRTVLIDESFNNMDPKNVKFAVDILLELGLQPLIISPEQNMSVVVPLVSSVCWVVKEHDKISKTRNLGIEEFKQLQIKRVAEA